MKTKRLMAITLALILALSCMGLSAYAAADDCATCGGDGKVGEQNDISCTDCLGTGKLTNLDNKNGDDTQYVFKQLLTTMDESQTNNITVQVSWVIPVITANVVWNKTWNSETLAWDIGDIAYAKADDITAEFCFLNYSSEKVNAQVVFEAEAGINATPAYYENEETEAGDGEIVLLAKDVNMDSKYSGEIDVKVPADIDFFKKPAASAATERKYGTYTVTITECEKSEPNYMAPDDEGAMWFNTTQTADLPTEVKSVAFTKTTPAESTYDATWTAPRHTTAYYNETDKSITYVLNEGFEKLGFTDRNLLKFGDNVLPGTATDDEVLAIYNEIAAEQELPTYATFEAFMASEYAEYYSMLLEESFSDYTFKNAESITGLTLWDVSRVTDFNRMFTHSKFKTLDLSAWNTESAKLMYSMFEECNSLETVTLGENWSTANVTSINSMFAACFKLKAIPTEGWDTSKVTDMSDAFSGCQAVATIDLSSFDTSNVTDMERMFASSVELTHIYIGDGWSVAGVTNSESMFESCSKLPNYNAEVINATKAFAGEGGYLSVKKSD